MKVVFLDYDGVVVVAPNARAAAQEPTKRLSGLLDRTGAKIVVSSTWRLGRSCEELAMVLYDAGLDPFHEVIGKTPWGVDGVHVERGYEIRAWLAEHPEVESFVVLDDDDDRGPLTRGRWIVVKDGFRNGGLQDEHVNAAARALAAPARLGQIHR